MEYNVEQNGIFKKERETKAIPPKHVNQTQTENDKLKHEVAEVREEKKREYEQSRDVLTRAKKNCLIQ